MDYVIEERARPHSKSRQPLNMIAAGWRRLLCNRVAICLTRSSRWNECDSMSMSAALIHPPAIRVKSEQSIATIVNPASMRYSAKGPSYT